MPVSPLRKEPGAAKAGRSLRPCSPLFLLLLVIVLAGAAGGQDRRAGGGHTDSATGGRCCCCGWGPFFAVALQGAAAERSARTGAFAASAAPCRAWPWSTCARRAHPHRPARSAFPPGLLQAWWCCRR